jgi:hypothetical protein
LLVRKFLACALLSQLIHLFGLSLIDVIYFLVSVVTRCTYCATVRSTTLCRSFIRQSKKHPIMLRSVAACALVGAVAVDAIATISAKGSKFFTSDGNQFYVKGMFSYFSASSSD